MLITRSTSWRFTIATIVLMVILQLLGPEYFRYQRDWVSGYEIWRLLSAHWIHLGWVHLTLNALGLLVCVSLTKPNWSIRYWCFVNVLLAIGISLLFTWRNPQLNWYVGYSGVLFGVYLLAAVDLFSRDRLISGLIILAITTKVLLEQFGEQDFSTAELIGAPVVIDAHLYGLLLAIIIALIRCSYTMNYALNKGSTDL